MVKWWGQTIQKTQVIDGLVSREMEWRKEERKERGKETNKKDFEQQ